MKILIVALIVGVIGLGAWQIFETWHGLKEKPAKAEQAPVTVPQLESLEGLPGGLEPSLQAAQRRGAAGLRDWLRLYGKTVRDPRLAAIELDYVVLVSRDDIGEARRVFSRVKTRTSPASPVYARIKQLEKTYQ